MALSVLRFLFIAESELRLEWTKQTPRQDQPPTQKKKKKKTGPQSGGPQAHRCKSSHDGARPRNKDPAGAPLAIKDHAATASSKDPARPRPSPRQPQPERVSPPFLFTFYIQVIEHLDAFIQSDLQ